MRYYKPKNGNTFIEKTLIGQRIDNDRKIILKGNYSEIFSIDTALIEDRLYDKDQLLELKSYGYQDSEINQEKS